MTNIKKLAEGYIKYSNKVRNNSEFGCYSSDNRTRGQKIHCARKYNKFADACEEKGLTLFEQANILREIENN